MVSNSAIIDICISFRCERSDYIMDMIEGHKTIEYRTWTTKHRGDLLMCGTAKKIAGGASGYAVAAVKITDIEWNNDDQIYEWHIAPFEKDGSYLIEPIPVKGQLKLFNVNDDLIKKAPFYQVDHSNPDFEAWWNKKVKPLIYMPKRKKKVNNRPTATVVYKGKSYTLRF